MKKRISLTVDEKLINNIDKLVDGNIVDSRSEAIERFLNVYMKENRYVVILAGGDPKNLFIPELNRYRPLVKIKGKPLIQRIIDKTVEIGYKNIIIVSSKEIINEIKNAINIQDSANIIFIEEKKHGHTANTLSYAKKYLKNTFLIVPCDHFFNFGLKKLEEIHAKNNFTCTLAIYAGAEYVWKTSAVVELDGNEIINYWEYPKTNKTFLTSVFIGFCEPDIFDFISNKKTSLQSDVFPTLVKRRLLGGAILSGNFVNIHTIQDVILAEKYQR